MSDNTPKADNEMPKAYEPSKVEKKWYDQWMSKGYFKPVIDKEKEPFTIIMPPPNITGELHLGHALTATLEDIMTRWHRMLGDPTLWLPGADHAGIAAQMVVERELAKEGKSKYDLGRDKFLEVMWQWAEKYKKRIADQHKRLGVSCDWDRECFTMDEGPCKAVRTIFKNLYDKGLIYRGERITNWCPRCSTVLSDLEVDHKELSSKLYYMKYPLENSENEFVIVATTRPETMLGDTGVAVNPADERYASYIGKKIKLPLTERVIPIIADEAVDTAFGTGAVKMTPAHDPVDFEVAQRHNLPILAVLGKDVKMNEEAGRFCGMDRFECRKAVLEALKEQELLVKIEDYNHSVGHCHRCHTMIEPLVTKQWFVKMEPLATPAIEAVKDGRIKIVPEHFTKVYLNWMENIRDWCVSRQLWWGHRIPVWYCACCGEIIVSAEDPSSCPKCSSGKLEQDNDVLDTWFSSGLWPHSTLGWPDDTEDLRYFYPTTVMETAYDILFFWVARMVMMGIEDMGEVPFRTIYLHGLIRDEKGEKMSKTKGNVIDPLKVIDEYGTDALRFAIINGTSPGNDSKLSDTKLAQGRNFANKLYNATRFVLRSVDEAGEVKPLNRSELALEDEWILSRLSRTASSASRLLEEFQFGEAQRQVHDFLWGEFCDWYIEIAKIRLRDENAVSPLPVLVHVIDVSLKLLHPFMPFVTEELWQNLKVRAKLSDSAESIMISSYPEAAPEDINPKAEDLMEELSEVVRSIRNARAQNKVEASRYIEASVYVEDGASRVLDYGDAIETLARVKPLNMQAGKRKEEAGENTLVLVLKGAEVVIPMASMIDLEAEKERIERETKELTSQITRLEKMLSNEGFISKAPPAVVGKERQKLEEYKDKLARIKES